MEEFVAFTTPEYQFGWFNRDVCRRLDAFLAAVARRESPRLMLFAPPRSGKSELVSRKFPAYALGRYSNLSILATSYGSDLSSRINRDVQRLIDDPHYSILFPETVLSGSALRPPVVGTWSRNSDIFEIVGHKGSYRSAGVGGGITGMGGDILIIDDPVKDAAQAASSVYRESVWDWYRATFYTRRAPGAGILLIATRWHLDDLPGRLLAAMENEGEHWDVASYQAIADDDEPHRKSGEALQPERYDLDALTATKAAIGSYTWESLYQQRPVAREGAMFKRHWFAEKIIHPERVPAGTRWVRHWDLAATARKTAARTAGVKLGRTPSGGYVVGHVVTTQSEGNAVRELIQMQAVLDGRNIEISLPQDPGQAGKVQARDFVAMLAGWNVHAEPETGDKMTRAAPFAAQCEAGNVQIVAGGWNDLFFDELCNFPSGAFKDQVDASSGAFGRLTQPEAPVGMSSYFTRRG